MYSFYLHCAVFRSDLISLCRGHDAKPVSYLLIRLVLRFSEKADVLDESGLDVFVIHKLAEDVKLLSQELISEIHLMV